VETPGWRERKKERTRETITRSALELFARDGFSATTLAAIAARAGVSPRTVSTYFPSKEDLVFWNYGIAIERLHRRLDERPAGRTVIDEIGGWFRDEMVAQADDEVSGMVRERTDREAVDYARMRQAAIVRDPELWGMERRTTRVIVDIVADAMAKERGTDPDDLPGRLLGATLTAVIHELNARAARGDRSVVAEFDAALRFLQAGTDALEEQ
jgi:AcrR family transcriptional regulator